MADEQEIISRPPSHPIATTLLLVSMIGTGLAIFLVWQELFGEYLPTPQPGAKAVLDSRKIAENHTRSHYENDFGKTSTDKNLMAEIEKELGIKAGNGVGGDLSSPSGSADNDGGDEGE